MPAEFVPFSPMLGQSVEESFTSMHLSIALFVAGLAFFFTGLSGVKNNLRQLTSRRFRMVMAKLTNRPVLAALWGLCFGAVTQSATAVAFILSGMISSGLISIRQALPVIAAANVGTVILVYLATIDMKLVILWLIGLTGVSMAFGAKGRWLAVMGALFGIGVLFFGLDMMKGSFKDLPNYPEFAWLMAQSDKSDLLVFLIGIALRTIIQSSSAIAVVAVTMANSGALSYEHSMLLILGTGPGVAVATWLLSGKLQGVGKQIVMYQAAVNLISGTTLAIIGAVLIYGVPGFHDWMESIPRGKIDTMLSLAYLVLQSSNFVLGLVGSWFATPWLEKLFPTTLEQDLSKPRHLGNQTADDPESALFFVEREQERYFDYLPQLLDCGRRRLQGKVETHRHVLKGGLLALGEEISNTIEDIASQQVPRDTLELLLVLQRRQGILTAMTENIFNLVNSDLDGTENPELANVYRDFIEGLDTILLISRDTAIEKRPDDLKLMLSTTSDRSNMMEKLRNSFFEDGMFDNSPKDKAGLFYVTMIFERLVWLLNMYAKALISQLEASGNSPDGMAKQSAPEEALT